MFDNLWFDFGVVFKCGVLGCGVCVPFVVLFETAKKPILPLNLWCGGLGQVITSHWWSGNNAAENHHLDTCGACGATKEVSVRESSAAHKLWRLQPYHLKFYVALVCCDVRPTFTKQDLAFYGSEAKKKRTTNKLLWINWNCPTTRNFMFSQQYEFCSNKNCFCFWNYSIHKVEHMHVGWRGLWKEDWQFHIDAWNVAFKGYDICSIKALNPSFEKKTHTHTHNSFVHPMWTMTISLLQFSHGVSASYWISRMGWTIFKKNTPQQWQYTIIHGFYRDCIASLI